MSLPLRTWLALCLLPLMTSVVVRSFGWLVILGRNGPIVQWLREFDLVDGRFVKDGFALPTSKQNADWIDENTLIVSRDWGTGSLTKSGYPFVVKILKRGQPLS